MSALAGTTAAAPYVHSTNDHVLAPGEHGTPTPHLAVGLAFGAIGALLVAIGGIGLPTALLTVDSRHLVTPEQRPALDAALRLAPVLFAIGVAHLIAAVGLLTATAWARAVGMTVSAAVAAIGVTGMVVMSSNVVPPGSGGMQNAAMANASGLVMLGFVVVAYGAALVMLLINRAPRRS